MRENRDQQTQIPTWNGEQSAWPDYVRQCRLAYETCERRKRKLLGPKLALKLTHKAWDVTYDISHERLRKSNGVKYLLNHLQERLGRTSVPDSGQKLEELFIKLRRGHGEAFSTWASRVMEAYKNVQRSLARVRRDNKPSLPVTPKSKARSVDDDPSPRRTHSEPQVEPPSPQPPRDEPGQTDGFDYTEVPQEDPSEAPEEEAQEWSWRPRDWWQRWDWRDSSWRKRDDDTSSEDEGPDTLTWAGLESADQEILPSEILGWLLLRRANLSAGARLTVQAAAHNSLRFEDVERALRDQQEELMMTESQGNRYSQQSRRTYWVEEDDQWALVFDHAIDEDQITPEALHWVSQPPVEHVLHNDFGGEDDETWFDGTYEWTYWSEDGEWHAHLEDGSLIAYSDMKPWLELDTIMMADPEVGKELYEAYTNFENRVRTFKEARWALNQKGKSRGFYKPKGKGKGKGKKGSKNSPSSSAKGSVMFSKGSSKGSSSSNPTSKPGYSGCFICGDLQHDYRNCPKRSQAAVPGKGGGKMVGYVTVESEGEQSEQLSSQPADPFVQMPGEIFMQEAEESETEGEDVATKILAAQEAVNSEIPPTKRLQYAVVDTGATETVGSLDALDAVMTERSLIFGNESIKVESEKKKNFKFGNAQTHRAESLVYLPQRFGNQTTALGVYALDVPNIPVLIGIRTLRRLGAKIDTAHDTIEFCHVFPGVQVPLLRGRNGHLLLNLCQDWMPQVNQVAKHAQTADTFELTSENKQLRETGEAQERTEHESGSRKDDREQTTAHMTCCPEPVSADLNSTSDTQLENSAQNVWAHSVASSLVVGSHDKHGQLQEDPGEGEGHDREKGREHGQVGLGSDRRSESSRPTDRWTAMQRQTPSNAERPWKQVRSQRLGPLGSVPALPTPTILHASCGCQRHSQISRTAAGGCEDSLGVGSGGFEHPGDCLECGGVLFGKEAGDSEARESPAPSSLEARLQPEFQSQTTSEDRSENREQRCSNGSASTSQSQERERTDPRTSGSRVGSSERREPDMRLRTPSLKSYEAYLTDIDSASSPGSQNLTETEENLVMFHTSQDTQLLLEQTLKASLDEVVDALSDLPSSNLDHMEICCGPESRLTARVQQLGGRAERVGLHNNMDLSKAFGLKRATEFCEATRPRYMWISTICGPTSPLQQLNTKTEKQADNLRKKQQYSRRMIKNCLILARDQIERGGHVTWEWPRANKAWKYKEVQQFFYELEQQGHMFEARLDGCQVGVVAPDNGKPMRKPWTIMSTDPHLSHCLDLSCNGSHEHVECVGHCRAAASALYPPRMCSIIARHVMSEQASAFLHTSETPSETFANEQASRKQKGEEETTGQEQQPTNETEGMTLQQLKHIKDAIHKLHVRSGHPTNQALVNCLRARGVPKHVLALAKEHKCDSCHEVKLPVPHAKVSLHKSEVLWQVVQMDIGQLKVGNTVIHFLLMMDEASRFASICELFRHPITESRNATTEEIIVALETHWCQHHGFPGVIRADPEGSFRGYNLSLWAQERGIDLALTPGEDHGQTGDVEALIGKIKHDTQTYMRDKDVDPFLGLLHMVHAHNTLDRVGGFAPCQWAYGRFPTFDGRLFDGGHSDPVHSSEGTPNTSMQRNLQLRVKAEEIYRKSSATSRINRAMNSKPTRSQVFIPGDMVFYRRYKTPSQLPSHKDLDTPKVGIARWYGPARVLATETRTETTEGTRRPGHVVWIVAGARLKRCSPHQLRHASEQEKLIAETAGAVTMPWSFTSVLSQVERGQFDRYDDLTFEENHPRQRPAESSFVPRTPRSRSRARSVQPVQTQSDARASEMPDVQQFSGRDPVLEGPQEVHKHLKRAVSENPKRPRQEPQGAKQQRTIGEAAPSNQETISRTGKRAPEKSVTNLDAQRFLSLIEPMTLLSPFLQHPLTGQHLRPPGARRSVGRTMVNCIGMGHLSRLRNETPLMSWTKPWQNFCMPKQKMRMNNQNLNGQTIASVFLNWICHRMTKK